MPVLLFFIKVEQPSECATPDPSTLQDFDYVFGNEDIWPRVKPLPLMLNCEKHTRLGW